MPVVAGPGDPGSTIVLNRLWLNSFDDPSDFMSFRIHSFTPSELVDGDVRKNAGGRLRLVLGAADSRSHTVEIRRPTEEQWQWLRDHKGALVILRDPDGSKYVATYLDLSRERPVEGADMTLNLTEVTASEVV